MFINHNAIRKVLDKYESRTYLGGKEWCMTNYECLLTAPKPYFQHTIYVVDDLELLKQTTFVKDMNLLVLHTGNEEELKFLLDSNSDINVTTVLTDCTEDVCRMLRNYYDEICGMGFIAHTLLDHLFYDEGIQDMVDELSNAFHNPVFVFDAGYRLIAANWDIAMEHEACRKMAQEMRVSDEDMQMINKKQPSHQQILASDKPTIVRHEKYGFDQMICGIDTKSNMGFIVINAINRPFVEMDEHMLIMLREGICQQLKLDTFIRNNRGYPYEFFVRDLIEGKLVAVQQQMEHFNYVNKEFSENMYCLVVESAKSTTTLNAFHVRGKLESLFPNTKTLTHNGEIIAFFCLQKDEIFTESKYLQLEKICKEAGIYAGISNRFESLMVLDKYYKQALRAIELGGGENRGPGLYIYSDYYLMHMTNIFLQKECSETYCHPKLKVLLNHDKENKTQLAYTLYMYLVNERNIAATSKAMFLHRNTIIYRLQKIDEMVDVLYEDFQERQYLILSYELCRTSEL